MVISESSFAQTLDRHCFPWSSIHQPWSSHIFERLGVFMCFSKIVHCTHSIPLPTAICFAKMTYLNPRLTIHQAWDFGQIASLRLSSFISKMKITLWLMMAVGIKAR